jgi:thiol:disulfide interchange protein DsbA
MDALRRSLVAVLALAPLAARAAPDHDKHDQRPYTELKPAQPVDATDKIEVAEFFWYGCPHCYKFEPMLEVWVQRLPRDVAFRRIPAILNARWENDAAIYYAFEALNMVGLHRPFSDAIHGERLRSDDPKALAAWLKNRGLEPARFDQTLKSFGVQARVKRARQLSVGYKIEGVPALAVHGRYTISTEQGGSFEGMLAKAQKLIELTRKELSAKR